MKHHSLYSTVLFIVCLPACFKVFAQHQIDTNYINRFAKTNVIEIYPGIYSTDFNFSSPNVNQRKTDYKLVANSNAYISTNLDYKWLSLNYSWAMPGTELDENVKLDYTSLELSFATHKMLFHPFYKSYNGLLIPVQAYNDSFTVFRGIQFTNAGIDFYYFTNTKLFSFSAARSFSLKQVKSAGSVFLMATPAWQKINWKDPSKDLIPDSATFNLLSQDPEWISLIARIGYTYNFIFKKGKWIIAPAILAGGGLLRETNTPDIKLQAVSNIQAWINAGYNGPNYYCYLHAWWNSLQTNLLIKNMTQVNTSISLTAGYRFHSLKKKILGLL